MLRQAQPGSRAEQVPQGMPLKRARRSHQTPTWSSTQRRYAVMSSARPRYSHRGDEGDERARTSSSTMPGRSTAAKSPRRDSGHSQSVAPSIATSTTPAKVPVRGETQPRRTTAPASRTDPTAYIGSTSRNCPHSVSVAWNRKLPTPTATRAAPSSTTRVRSRRAAGRRVRIAATPATRKPREDHAFAGCATPSWRTSSQKHRLVRHVAPSLTMGDSKGAVATGDTRIGEGQRPRVPPSLPEC